jgi:hypothetical protein
MNETYVTVSGNVVVRDTHRLRSGANPFEGLGSSHHVNELLPTATPNAPQKMCMHYRLGRGLISRMTRCSANTKTLTRPNSA